MTNPATFPQKAASSPQKLKMKIVNDHSKMMGKAPAPEITSLGLNCLSTQREQISRRKGGKFSMILAGCSGTGKTTFLNTLFGVELDDKSEIPTPFVVRERKYELTQDNFVFQLTAVDLPGFGIKMDNQYSWLPLVKYIDHHFMSYLLQEEQPDRSQLVDNRVHVCLYFLPPSNTQLTPLDIEAMKELSQRVNLIPLIARSDTLNREELTNFKKIVNNTLNAYNIKVCQFVSDNYVWEKIKSFVPYAVIGSNTLGQETEGTVVRVRKYHWGTAEIENPEHCDFVYLREVLMSEHILDLMTAMESHYAQYRTRCLQGRLTKAIRDEHHLSHIDSECSGLQAYLLYKRSAAPQTLELIEGSFEEEQMKKESRDRFDDMIRNQEAKFREWKSTLLAKQKFYNKDLEEAFLMIKSLQSDILRAGPRGVECLKQIEIEMTSLFGKLHNASDTGSYECDAMLSLNK